VENGFEVWSSMSALLRRATACAAAKLNHYRPSMKSHDLPNLTEGTEKNPARVAPRCREISLANRVQLTNDGHRAYLEAVEGAFGSDIDYAMLVKLYGPSCEGEKRYSPAECIGAVKHRIKGKPPILSMSVSGLPSGRI
jgi:hypothetical protein